jgi:hypothetical protein
LKLLKRVHIAEPKTDLIAINIGSSPEEEAEVTEAEVIVVGMTGVGAEDGEEEAIKIDAEDILFHQETHEVMPPASALKTSSLNFSSKGLPFRRLRPA